MVVAVLLALGFLSGAVCAPLPSASTNDAETMASVSETTLEPNYGWSKREGKNVTFGFQQCYGWTYTAITQNIVRASIMPLDFPPGCSPEKDILVVPRFYSRDDCLPGEDCESKGGKLVDATDMCDLEGTWMVPFEANDAPQKLVLESDPVCSQEKKALFAIESRCPDPVTIYMEFERRRIRASFNEICDTPDDIVSNILYLVVLTICFFALFRFLRVCVVQKLMLKYNVLQVAPVYRPVAVGHRSEAQPFIKQAAPLEAAPLLLGDALNAANERGTAPPCKIHIIPL